MRFFGQKWLTFLEVTNNFVRLNFVRQDILKLNFTLIWIRHWKLKCLSDKILSHFVLILSFLFFIFQIWSFFHLDFHWSKKINSLFYDKVSEINTKYLSLLPKSPQLYSKIRIKLISLWRLLGWMEYRSESRNRLVSLTFNPIILCMYYSRTLVTLNCKKEAIITFTDW